MCQQKIVLEVALSPCVELTCYKLGVDEEWHGFRVVWGNAHEFCGVDEVTGRGVQEVRVALARGRAGGGALHSSHDDASWNKI